MIQRVAWTCSIVRDRERERKKIIENSIDLIDYLCKPLVYFSLTTDRKLFINCIHSVGQTFVGSSTPGSVENNNGLSLYNVTARTTISDFIWCKIY